MKENVTKTGWDRKLDEIGDRLKTKEVTIPVELIGAVLALVFAAAMLIVMPQQVEVSETDVVNGRVFPMLLMIVIIAGSVLLIIQTLMKMAKKQPVETCTLNLLVEVKALIILGILFATYLISKLTDLFVLGGIFCSVSFLLFFRCKNKQYYAITVGLAVLIWVAFRFGLGVRF